MRSLAQILATAVVVLAVAIGALILVVDDDPSIRHLVADCLGDDPGVQMAEAHNGRAALEVIAREPPALVLLDLSMPEVDGLEVARRLKGDPATRAIPLVAMSAGGRRSAALASGCDDFIAKPFDLNDLAALVHGWLARARTASRRPR